MADFSCVTSSLTMSHVQKCISDAALYILYNTFHGKKFKSSASRQPESSNRLRKFFLPLFEVVGGGKKGKKPGVWKS